MWFIEDYEIRTIQLDFTSSGGGRPRSRSVFSGGVQLVNAGDFADLSSDPTQVHVCEQCGVVGCADGGYVRLRRIDDVCIWLPDFSAMLAPDWESGYFTPPACVKDRGIPAVSRCVYSRLESEMGQLPPFDDLRPLLAPDAAKIVQWDAPLCALGTFAVRPTLVRECILAVSNGDAQKESDSLQLCLDSFMDYQDCAVDLTLGGQSVEFHLDGPRLPSWTPMRRHDDFTSLQLHDRLAVRLPEHRVSP